MVTAVQQKPMKTEANRAFKCGFALNEAELRRLHEVLVLQIKRASVDEACHTSYELKYRNGSVSYPVSLDDILAQENFGSGTILRMKMGVASQVDEARASNRI